ncbi:MAG: hypothetical protein ACW97X_11460, partial [Candidatus Hodarchaeales archaeon]
EGFFTILKREMILVLLKTIIHTFKWLYQKESYFKKDLLLRKNVKFYTFLFSKIRIIIDFSKRNV